MSHTLSIDSLVINFRTRPSTMLKIPSHKTSSPPKTLSYVTQQNYTSTMDLKERQKSLSAIQSEHACYLFRAKKLRSASKPSVQKIEQPSPLVVKLQRPSRVVRQLTPQRKMFSFHVISQPSVVTQGSPVKQRRTTQASPERKADIMYPNAYYRLLELINKQQANPGVFRNINSIYRPLKTKV